MDSHLVLIANAGDGTISSFDLTGGTLTPLATGTAGGPGLPLAVDARRDLVFAGTSEPVGISVLKLDRASGTLTQTGRHDALGAAAYLTMSHDGSLLLAASYHGHVGQVWRVAEDGGLTPAGEPIHYRNLHSVAVSADDAYAYFVSLRDDLVAQYALAADGTLTPLDPPTVAAPAGSGPRHLVFNSDETSLYVNTEYSGEVLQYRRDPADGTLQLVAITADIPTDRGLGHSRFGAKPRDENLIWGSDLHLADGDRRLYSAERTLGTITALDIDEDGTPGLPTAHTDVVPQPRSFAVLPDGNLLVASEITPQVAIYRPSPTGQLDFVSGAEVGDKANWIEVLPR